MTDRMQNSNIRLTFELETYVKIRKNGSVSLQSKAGLDSALAAIKTEISHWFPNSEISGRVDVEAAE